MGGIFVVVEHRQGKVRDITLEMLAKAGELKNDLGGDLTAVLLGWETGPLIEALKGRSDKILVIEDERVKNFEAEVYKLILRQLMQEYQPALTLIGQTSWGLDLAPCLAVKMGFPLVTDCLDTQDRRRKAKGPAADIRGQSLRPSLVQGIPRLSGHHSAGRFFTRPVRGRSHRSGQKRIPAGSAGK